MNNKQTNPDFDINSRRLQLLSYIVIIYMFLAFSWWAVLLYTKNKDAFEAKANFMRLGMMVEKQFESEALFLENPKYLALKKKYDTQKVWFSPSV
ncbi:MAG: hypothetical protein IPL95_04670 [Saprospiraceae bacterium]|nr:hypothetical protein [Saprospiraceae bacterium]